MKLVFLVVLVALVAYVFWPPSKIQAVTTENYQTRDPTFDSPGGNITVVTPDEMEKVIRATQSALSKQIGKCTYCLETTSINLTDNVYSGRFLFSVIPGQGGGAYGVAVDANIDKAKDYTVKNIALQSMNTIDAMDPYTQFKSGAEIQEANLPKFSDLKSVMSA
jgi:hypothetical protein